MTVLVRLMVGIIYLLVGPPSEVAQGTLLELLLGYSPLEVVSLVGGAAMLNISASGFRAAVCLSPNVVSGIVGVWLMRVCMRSTAACVSTYFDDIIGNVRFDGENSVV